MREYDGSIEIRLDDKGGIDEIVGNGVLVHIERMDKGSWFISLTRPDQTEEAFWLHGKGKVEFTMNEARPAPESGPNATPWTLKDASGRLAGLREAAEVARGCQTFDWKGGEEWAAGYVDGKNAAADAIDALATSKDTP